MARVRQLRVRSLVLGASTLALAVLLALAWLRLHRLSASVDGLEKELGSLKRSQASRSGEARQPVSPLLLDYQLEVPGRGEVFPAMWATHAPEYWPVATLRLVNGSPRAVLQTVSAEIPGWSRRSEESVVLEPGEARQVLIQPDLLPRAYENEEIHRATLEVRTTGPDGSLLFAQSRSVLVHGGSEIYWGRRFGNAQVAARWVTPHDASVLALVSEARRYVPRGRLAGYNASGGRVEPQVRAQAAAVFRALQRSGLS
jgi:hypothetical protein